MFVQGVGTPTGGSVRPASSLGADLSASVGRPAAAHQQIEGQALREDVVLVELRGEDDRSAPAS